MDQKVLKIFLISNMYPSEWHPRYGIFVKNFEDNLVKNNISFPVKAVLQNTKKVGFFHKVSKYATLYLRIIYYGLFYKRKYDLIYVHFPIFVVIPLLVILLFKQRLVLNFHGSDLYPNTLLKKLLNPLQIYLTNRALAVVVPSEYFKHEVQARTKIPENKILVYPSSGIDKNIFYKISVSDHQSLRQKLQYKDETLIIGFASNFIAGKGWAVLLDAIKLLSDNVKEDFKVILIGDGPDRMEIMEISEALGINNRISILDSMDQKELARYYNIFDVFVFPTTRESESLGLVGIEAMACGTPVIGSAIAGLKGYLLDDINGYFFSPGNADDLYRKLKFFIHLNPRRREQMIHEAEKTAIPYEAAIVNKEMARSLKWLINER